MMTRLEILPDGRRVWHVDPDAAYAVGALEDLGVVLTDEQFERVTAGMREAREGKADAGAASGDGDGSGDGGSGEGSA